jgi:hypothetical protein
MASDLYVILINRLGRNENGLFRVVVIEEFLLDFTSEKKDGVSVFIVYSGMGTIGR